MINTKSIIPSIFGLFLSDKTRAIAENIILKLALLSFFIHLAIIYLIKFDFLALPQNSELLTNPISAVYTPFSFILIYEGVLLMLLQLPIVFTKTI